MLLFFTIKCFVAIAFGIKSFLLAALSMGFTIKQSCRLPHKLYCPMRMCVRIERGGLESFRRHFLFRPLPNIISYHPLVYWPSASLHVLFVHVAPCDWKLLSQVFIHDCLPFIFQSQFKCHLLEDTFCFVLHSFIEKKLYSIEFTHLKHTVQWF